MVKITTFLLLILLAAPSCHAQIIGVGNRKTFSPSGVTWSVVQELKNNTCAAATCTISAVNVTAGDLVILAGISASSTVPTLSSASGGGATWIHCPATASNLTFSGFIFMEDCFYALAAPSMTSQTISITFSGQGTIIGDAIQLVEVHRSTGTATYDTGAGVVDTGCTSCSGATLTLTGSSDYVLSVGAATAASTGAGTTWNQPFDYAVAGAINRTTGAPPLWQFSSSVNAAIGEVAFK